MIVSGRQTFVATKKDNSGKIISEQQPAVKWLLDVMITNDANGPALKDEVFRIENDQVLSLLQLKPRTGFRYSFNEMAGRLMR